MSLSPWDGKEEHGLNLAPGVQKEPPIQISVLPSAGERGPGRLVPGSEGTMGAAHARSSLASIPKPGPNHRRAEAESLKDIPRGWVGWKRPGCLLDQASCPAARGAGVARDTEASPGGMCPMTC